MRRDERMFAVGTICRGAHIRRGRWEGGRIVVLPATSASKGRPAAAAQREDKGRPAVALRKAEGTPPGAPHKAEPLRAGRWRRFAEGRPAVC